jgi:hypothetical protein
VEDNMANGGSWLNLDLISRARLNQKTCYVSLLTPEIDNIPDLISYYALEDSVNDGFNTHNGTNVGATYVAGIFGKGLSFDGSNDYVDIATSTDFDFYPTTDDGISWSFWIKTTDANTRDLISRLCGAGLSYWIIRIVGGRIYGQFWDGTYGSWSYSVGTINDGTWHHVVVTLTFATNVTKIYIDGIDDTEQWGTQDIGDYFSGTYAIKIAQGTFSGGYFAGVLDEIRFYSRALTQAEVTSLHLNIVFTYVGQLWYDLTNDLLKVRNSTNTAWKTVTAT